MIALRSCRDLPLLLALVGVAYCYPSFQQNIPNGELVPHPCNPNYLWKGVGHKTRGGGGVRNDFGTDFAANNFQWTRTLCMSDSDGDGQTNGQELGDPDCVWTPGQAPARSAGLSHPGICEPIDSDRCRDQASFVTCEKMEFDCPALDEPGVFNMSVRMPVTPVPAEETTYMCMAFDFPSTGDYHMIGNTPVIDNINVMHHVVVYGCGKQANQSNQEHPVGVPYNCFMSGTEGCNDIIAIWAVGVDGQCIHPDTGFRVGINANAYHWGIMEMHWNNPTFTSGWTDSSGLMFYMTPNRRRYDAGMAMVGQNLLEIPPGETNHVESSRISSTCTRSLLNGPLSVVGATNHMHYLDDCRGLKGNYLLKFPYQGTPAGAAAATYVQRGDESITYIAKDDTLSYDSPIFYTYDDPIRVNPGDELHMDCHFRSTSRSKTTYFGEGTQAEMCFAFIMYYPRENLMETSITNYGEADPCDLRSKVVMGCDFNEINDYSNPETLNRYISVTENCAVGSCRKECKAIVSEVKKHPCFTGTPRRVQLMDMSYAEGWEAKYNQLNFWAALDSCDEELLRDRIDEIMAEAGTSSAESISHVTGMAMLAVLLPVLSLVF